jgi:hypothetical protein
VQLLPCLTLAGKLLVVPVNRFQNYDIHFLRPDLLQDPSFFDRATGGFGMRLDATLSYQVWRGLSLELGYRLWKNRAGLGFTTSRSPEGDSLSPLHQVETLRQGLLLGLQWRF